MLIKKVTIRKKNAKKNIALKQLQRQKIAMIEKIYSVIDY